MKKLKACKKGGTISKTGYLNDSPDRFNEYNIIPSNQITMMDVEHPVFGVDDLGYEQMMYPGQEYEFPGDYVTEYPMNNMKNGGVVKGVKKNFLEKYNIFNVVNSPTVDMFDSTIIKAQMGAEAPWRTPTQSMRPDEYSIDPFADPAQMATQSYPTKPFSIPDYIKAQGANKLMTRASSNLMNELIDPTSFTNIAGYAETGVNFLNNRRQEADRTDWLQSQYNTDNLYPVQAGGDRGDYVVNGSAYGQFRPDELGAKSPYGMTGNYYPSYQMGGQARTKPTAIDSADLYKNAALVRGYYSKLRGYAPHPTFDDFGNIKKAPSNIYKALDDTRKDMMTRTDNIMLPGSGGKWIWGEPDKVDFYKKVDDNRFFQRELSTGSLDTRAPKTLYDRRIVPDDVVTLVNNNKKDQMFGDFVELPAYNPAKIKPWNMLTPTEKQVRMKEQGKTPPKLITKAQTRKPNPVVPNTYTVPNDLEWTDIETPISLPEVKINGKKSVVTYPFGKRGETMTQEEWDYTRKKRGYPDVYSDRNQGGTDNFIPGEIFSNEVRNDVMEYRKKKNKMEYGGQNGFALDLNTRRLSMTSDSDQNPISKTLQPVDEDEANIEAELGETIFGDFDNDGINEQMNIGGRKHSQGGTPIQAPPASFIFSDTKKLKIAGEVLEEFGKPEGTKKKYTPAELAKQYDVNKFKAIIDDPDADPVKKRTAEMMLSNYNDKLGKLALLQESKKGFPDGVPQVAIPYLMSQIGPEGLEGLSSQDGIVEATFAEGGEYDPFVDPYKGGRTTAGTITPTGKKNPYNRKQEHLAGWEQIIPGISQMPNAKAQALMYQYNLSNNPQSIKDMWSQYGLTAKGLRDKNLSRLADNGIINPNNLTPENLQKLESAYADGFFGVRQMDPVKANNPQLPNIPTRTITPNPPTITPPVSQIPKTTDPNEFVATQGSNAPTDFWTQDKINTAYALQNKANLKKYLPWAAPIVGVTADPTFYDPNRELAANAELANTEMMYANQFSGPQSVSARNSAVAGNAAGNVANILGKYNNLNVGLANQFAAQDADIMNQLSSQSATRANNLYQGQVVANQQYDNSRSQANDVVRRNLLSGLDNMQKTQWINEWYPQYNLDPSTGYVNFEQGSGRSSITPGAPAAKGYLDVYKQLRRENPDVPDEVLREQAKQMTGTARTTVNNEGDVRSTFNGAVPQQLMNLLKFQGG